MKKYLAIIDDVSSDKIDYKEGLDKLKSLPKPWHTSYWRKMRDLHLKDKCENCGSKEKPLVIQHYKQPEKFRDIKNQVGEEYKEKFKNSFSEMISEEQLNHYLDFNSEKRIICPICENVSVRTRKTTNDMICAKKHVFKRGKEVTYFTASRTINYARARNSAINKLRYEWVKHCFKVCDLEIGKKALMLSLEQGIEYRNFKYIKTCCKRCAAIEDKVVPDYALCSQCNESYHHPKYDICYNCFSIENEISNE